MFNCGSDLKVFEGIKGIQKYLNQWDLNLDLKQWLFLLVFIQSMHLNNLIGSINLLVASKKPKVKRIYINKCEFILF